MPRRVRLIAPILGVLLAPLAAAPARALLPQITVDKPPTWETAFVPRTNADADTASALAPSPQLSPTAPAYLNWAVSHNAAVSGYWADRLLVDGEPIETLPRYNAAFASRWWYSLNRGPLFLRGGRHTITGQCDIFMQIDESVGARGDNERREQYLWTPEPLASVVTRNAAPPAEAPEWLLPSCDAFAAAPGAGVPWAVALKPFGGDDDLVVYDDYLDSRNGLTVERGASRRAGDALELVVGGADAPSALYPAALRATGQPGAPYHLHFVDAAGRVDGDGDASWPTESLTSNEWVRVYQVTLQAGVASPMSAWRLVGDSPLAFAVFPASGGAARTLAEAVAVSHPSTYTPGLAVASFTPAETGAYAIAVYKEANAGAAETRYRFAVGSQTLDAPPPAEIAFALAGANPSAGPVRLRFALPVAGEARIDVLDVQGRHVRALVRGARPAGPAEETWDLRDDAGSPVAPGLYWARFEAAGLTRAVRLAIVR